MDSDWYTGGLPARRVPRKPSTDIDMAEQTEFERQMAEMLVSALDLEDVEPGSIMPDAPLFGHGEDSLGLDSIDALEIALAVKQQFGVELRADDERNSRIFATLRALSSYVEDERVAG